MKKKNNILLLLFLSLFIVSAACNQESGGNSEELTKITVYCEEGIYDMMKPLCSQFDSIDATGELVLKKSSAFDAMAKLLAGEAHVILLARDYSKYEDSMMTAFAVKQHERMSYATDALIFYVSVKSELDSLNDNHLKNFFNNSAFSLNSINKKFPAECQVVSNSHLSSEFYNLKKFMNNNKNLARKIKFFNSSDSVKNYVYENTNAIGVGYLSQIVQESRFRAIAVSFNDSLNKYVYPHVVHQANLAQRLYPYIVYHKAYIFDDRKDLPMRFGRFLSKSSAAQKYFNNYGIVPAFAKIKLIEEG